MLTVTTILGVAAFCKGIIQGVYPVFLATVLLGCVSLSFVPKVRLINSYQKDGESFLPLEKGWYTLDSYNRNLDWLYAKQSKVTMSPTGQEIVIVYFVPLNLTEQDVKRFTIFQQDCAEYCQSGEDLKNTANFHGIEGFAYEVH